MGTVKDKRKKYDVTIIGGGLAGMSAAMLLADRGFQVALAEKLSAVGGYFPLLERQFPTNSCGVCFLSPKPAAYCPFVECSLRENITILDDAELEEVTGSDDNFKLSFRRFNFVDNSRCIDCGKCIEVCPVETRHEFGDGMETRKAVYKQFPKMTFRGYRIDTDACTRCSACVEACPAGAIDLKREPGPVKIVSRKVILSPGFGHNVKKLNAGYGLGYYKNVVTSVQFERLVSASGPTSGTVLRPGDGKPAETIAFIQCAGSRALKKRGNPYCSSVCCMIAVKQALLTKEQNPDVRIKIFYMDMRTSGKGYEEYLNRAKETEGIGFVRFHITSLNERRETGNILIGCSREGRYIEEEFDLAVLSVGFYQDDSVRRLLADFGVDVNAYGFAETDEFGPNRTNIPGVFAAGAVTEPMDIIDATASGASAAALVMEELACGGTGRDSTPIAENAAVTGPGSSFSCSLRAEGSALGEGRPRSSIGPARGASAYTAPPRIGVLLCTCSDTVDPQILRHCNNFSEVVWTGTADLLCIHGGTGAVKKAIAENGLQRMVIAGCSIRELQVLFRSFFEETGYSELDFEFVNIRDALIFQSAETAKQLLGYAVSKVRRNRVPEVVRPAAAAESTDRSASADREVQSDVLVIGGGIAGLTAALRCANQGLAVVLIEKEDRLGGRLKDAYYTLKGSGVQALLQALIQEVENHGKIEIYTSTEAAESSGTAGNRTTRLVRRKDRNEKACGADDDFKSGGTDGLRSTHDGGGSDAGRDGTVTITHSAVIIATGGKEAVPESYGYGESPGIMTQAELERQIGTTDFNAGKYSRVVMIQCVESRELGRREYCSRVCCNHALKNILKLKELSEDIEITVLHRDIRSYGFYEDYYQQVRNSGVLFVEYDPETRPQVECRDGQIKVVYIDPVLDAEIVQETELLVLSTGMVPNLKAEPAGNLQEIFQLTADSSGFFEEVNKKAGTVKSVRKDIFFCGLCQGPKHIEESIMQANAAAAHASVYLNRQNAQLKENRAFVIERFCSGCGICVEVCPYSARLLNQETSIAEVIDHLCEGCGACVSACPNGAAQMYGYEKEQVLDYVDMVCEYTK